MIQTFDEPTWGLSQDTVPDASAFCRLGPSPFILTGVFVRLIKYHYSDANNIDNPVLKGYIWTSNQSCDDQEQVIVNPDTGQDETITVPASNLLVGTNFGEDFDAANTRPAIFVRRETFQTVPVANRNEILGGINCGQPVRGQQMLMRINGAHSIICAGLTGAEAEQLLEETYFRMLQYMSVIRDDFKLAALTVGAGSPVETADLGGGKKTFYCSFNINWAYVYRWTLIRINPEFRRTLIEYVQQEPC